MQKKSWATLIAALATTCCAARAENVGLSYLGICNRTWQCSRSIAAFNGVSTIRTGWLEQSFGERCQCADKLLQDERPKEIRVHLANGPCMRNRRCGRHEVFYGHTVASSNRAIKKGNRRLVGRFERVAARLRARLAQSRGPLTCYVSPVLESDNDETTRRILHRLAGAYLPNCSLVDSVAAGKCIPGATCERHGKNPNTTPPCIADLDGIDATTISVPKFLRQTKACDMSLIWTLGLNCIDPHSQTFIDPRQRDCVRFGANWRGLAGWLHREFR